MKHNHTLDVIYILKNFYCLNHHKIFTKFLLKCLDCKNSFFWLQCRFSMENSAGKFTYNCWTFLVDFWFLKSQIKTDCLWWVEFISLFYSIGFCFACIGEFFTHFLYHSFSLFECIGGFHFPTLILLVDHSLFENSP